MNTHLRRMILEKGIIYFGDLSLQTKAFLQLVMTNVCFFSLLWLESWHRHSEIILRDPVAHTFTWGLYTRAQTTTQCMQGRQTSLCSQLVHTPTCAVSVLAKNENSYALVLMPALYGHN